MSRIAHVNAACHTCCAWCGAYDSSRTEDNESHLMNAPWRSVAMCDASFAMSDVSCISLHINSCISVHINNISLHINHTTTVTHTSHQLPWRIHHINYRDTHISATTVTHTSQRLLWHTHHFNCHDTHITSTTVTHTSHQLPWNTHHTNYRDTHAHHTTPSTHAHHTTPTHNNKSHVCGDGC